MTPPPADTPAAPYVRDREGVRTLHFSDIEIQSSMSLRTPDALELEYTRMMMGFLLFLPEPRRLLLIGLGGGSMVKFCHRHLPATALDVVEIDPRVIALRHAFQVPPDDGRLRIVEADGADYLRGDIAAPDVMLLDGFGPTGLPEQLGSRAFYEDCYRNLAPDGLLVANLHLNRPHYDRCLAHLRQVFGASLLEVIDDDMTNSIVFARKGEPMDALADTAIRRPPSLGKDAWRQLMPTFRVIAATMVCR